MDKEIKQKDTKTDFLEKKIGIPDCKHIEEMNNLGLHKTSSKRKRDRIMERLIQHSTITNTKKNKKP